MLNNLENQLIRTLEYEEHQAILAICNEIKKGFKRTVFKLTITRHEGYPDIPRGFLIQFDNEEVGIRGNSRLMTYKNAEEHGDKR